MADKLTHQLTDALTRAAADPGGLPLFAAKAEPGLFPPAAAARPAAQKALADGLVRVVRAETKGKTGRDLYGLTEAGWEFLLAAANPKQVLEDFVRVLESRQGEVGELLAVARRMADSLHGLKEAVARVLPTVATARVVEPARRDAVMAPALRSADSASRLSVGSSTTAVLEPPVIVEADLADAILTRLADWSGAAGEDCPLPELFRGLSTRDPEPTIGAFHDALRALHAAGSVYLHPWTGPLYALAEPAFALLVGHGVAYYASLKQV